MPHKMDAGMMVDSAEGLSWMSRMGALYISSLKRKDRSSICRESAERSKDGAWDCMIERSSIQFSKVMYVFFKDVAERTQRIRGFIMKWVERYR